MRTFDSKDEYDREEVKRIGAEPWMLEILLLNPDYVHWGPGEDYMPASDRDGGWASSVRVDSWSDFDWKLDEYNECVNFYFQIHRASESCDCDGGYNAATRKIYEGFYKHLSGAACWRDKLTQDDVDALCEAGRLNCDFNFQKWNEKTKKWERTGPNPTAEQVNAWSKSSGLGHDSINCSILVEARARRLGVFGYCERCQGHGRVYTEPKAHLSLVLWIIHPRKGAARGVEIMHLDKKDVPKACAWLKEAAERNAERFAKAAAFKGK